VIQVDDSGWGSLLGGVCIGVYNTGNNKLYSRLIPIKYFQEKNFKNKAYLSIACDIVIDGMKKICTKTPFTSVDNITEVQVCRGYLLSEVRKRLEITGSFTNINYVDIKDPLQSALEKKFAISLRRHGVPNKSGGAHGLSFEDMLAWINEDSKRVKYVKTGWKSWQTKYSKGLR